MTGLWEGGVSTPAQLAHRIASHDVAVQISQQVQYWMNAEQLRQ